jgi:hypothetical protein
MRWLVAPLSQEGEISCPTCATEFAVRWANRGCFARAEEGKAGRFAYSVRQRGSVLLTTLSRRLYNFWVGGKRFAGSRMDMHPAMKTCSGRLTAFRIALLTLSGLFVWLSPGVTRARNVIDVAPVSNADIGVTLAHVLSLELPKNGHLTGRIIDEALVGGPESVSSATGIKMSAANAAGTKTYLRYQKVNDTFYLIPAASRDGPSGC